MFAALHLIVSAGRGRDPLRASGLARRGAEGAGRRATLRRRPTSILWTSLLHAVLWGACLSRTLTACGFGCTSSCCLEAQGSQSVRKESVKWHCFLSSLRANHQMIISQELFFKAFLWIRGFQEHVFWETDKSSPKSTSYTVGG